MILGKAEPMASKDKHVDILILDDDIDLLTTTAELLADMGYKVKGFADPESALEFAIGQTFSVGLFDFRLGSIKNGLDVVETMQALGCKSVYVMVSADVESSTRLRAINLKLFEFMRKPIAPEDLLETVSRAFAQSQQMAA